MHTSEKNIHIVLSPHINYYHSYRGDSKGGTGFGLDLEIMEYLITTIDELEAQGYCNGKIHMSWDYADTYWSIQLQQQFQPDILKRVQERCQAGKDEVLIGSWGNQNQAVLNTEEFIQATHWYKENKMEIGLKQLFPGRIAPYARNQECMYTPGMIELFDQTDIEGLLVYYSAIPFDQGRPFIKPKLTWEQRYGLVNLQSTISDASTIMIPTYGFGDIVDHLSLEKWLKFIHKKQNQGLIPSDALLVINFDMDSYTWRGMKMPKILQWMPNSGGIKELIKVIDNCDYADTTTLLDIIPRLKPKGSVKLYQDTADGTYNGFYNWAQKTTNTEFWTLGQQARWLKATTDTIVEKQYFSVSSQLKSQLQQLLRSSSDLEESYMKNNILFTSTTNFGMAMPFLHPDRQKTSVIYGVRAYQAAKEALNELINEIQDQFIDSNIQAAQKQIYIIPITIRGPTEGEYNLFPTIFTCKYPLQTKLT